MTDLAQNSQMSISMTIPLYYASGRAIPAAGIIAHRKTLNIAKIGLAYNENGLLGIRTMMQSPADAINDINQVSRKQKHVAQQANLYNGVSATVAGTGKIAKMTLRFQTSNEILAQLQAEIAREIAPIATMMFPNRMNDDSGNIPVYETSQPNAKTTAIQLDTPSDPQRVAAYFAGLMTTEQQAERTLSILRAPDDSAGKSRLLFDASRANITELLPNDPQDVSALERSSLKVPLASKQTALVYQ